PAPSGARRDVLRHARPADHRLLRGTNESAAIRLRDDVRGEQALELREIAALRRGNEGIEETSLLGVADACAPSIRDMLACARDELTRVRLFDVENLRDLFIRVAERFAQHVRGAFRRREPFEEQED